MVNPKGYRRGTRYMFSKPFRKRGELFVVRIKSSIIYFLLNEVTFLIFKV